MPTEGEEENARARIIAALHDEASGRVVRCCKLALDRGLGDTRQGPAAPFMNSPPVPHGAEPARQMDADATAPPGAPRPGLEGGTPPGPRGGAAWERTVQRSP